MSAGLTVVGVDGSGTALEAVRWAAKDAELHESAVLLLSSMCPSGATILPAAYRASLRSGCERALSEARRTIAAAMADGSRVGVRVEIVTEAPIASLLTRSETAWMLVVGDRGHRRIVRASMGSVSTALASHCRCPLTVVGERSAYVPVDSAVVVGTDCSAACATALETAFDQASARGVAVTVVHAWADSDLALMGSDQNLARQWPVHRADAQEQLDDALANVRARYPAIPVRAVVVRDRPARALLDHAQAAQLVVVGSRGRGGFSGMLLGSTSRDVLAAAHCPITVVRWHRGM